MFLFLGIEIHIHEYHAPKVLFFMYSGLLLNAAQNNVHHIVTIQPQYLKIELNGLWVPRLNHFHSALYNDVCLNGLVLFFFFQFPHRFLPCSPLNMMSVFKTSIHWAHETLRHSSNKILHRSSLLPCNSIARH